MASDYKSNFEEKSENSSFLGHNTDCGIEVPDIETCINEENTQIKDSMGNDLDTTPQTIVGRIVEALGMMRAAALGSATVHRNLLNPSGCFGRWLDALGSIWNLTRKSATYTKILVSMKGIPKIVVPIGTKILSSDGRYVTVDAAYDGDDGQSASKDGVTINETGEATAICRYQDIGKNEIDATDFCIISKDTAPSGLFFAKGTETYVGGEDEESDEAFRARIKEHMKDPSPFRTCLNNYAKKLIGKDLGGLFVYDNMTSKNVSISGSTKFPISIPPFSICCVADIPESCYEKLAKAMHYSKSVGAGMKYCSGEEGGLHKKNEFGENTDEWEDVGHKVSYVDENTGVPYTYMFNTPVYRKIKVRVKVVLERGTSVGLWDRIRDNIIAWSKGEIDGEDGLTINTPVSGYTISKVLTDAISEITIKDIKSSMYLWDGTEKDSMGIVHDRGEVKWEDVLTMDFVEKGSISREDIYVMIWPKNSDTSTLDTLINEPGVDKNTLPI